MRPSQKQTRQRVKTISIPIARWEQLEKIREVLEKRHKQGRFTFTDLMGHFVEREIETGTIPDIVPGYEIEVTKKTATFRIRGVEFQTCNPSDLSDMAKAFECLYWTEKETRRNILHAGLCELSAGGYFEVARSARGVRFELRPRKGKRVASKITHDIARDLARQLRIAARKLRPVARTGPAFANASVTRRRRRHPHSSAAIEFGDR